jgi:polysaccharide biosynthesis protein PslH
LRRGRAGSARRPVAGAAHTSTDILLSVMLPENHPTEIEQSCFSYLGVSPANSAQRIPVLKYYLRFDLLDMKRVVRKLAMKILWVKAGGLVPPDTGGKIRSYNILRELAREHSVTLFSFYAAHANDQHASLNSIFDRVACVPLEMPAPKSGKEFLNYLRYALSLDSYSAMKFSRPPVKTALRALLSETEVDIIVCDFLVAGPAIPWDFPCPKVLFAHNVEAMIWKRHYEVARNPLWKAISWREWKTMERAERAYLNKADHVLAVSEADASMFSKFMNSSKITVIPTGVDTEFFQPQPDEELPNSLVFTGSMDWLPNEDGIFYFADKILPRIRQQVPDVKLWVVGRKPSARLQELSRREPHIEITGWVEDVRPYLAKGAVCIVPLRIGGGTRLKIFEAMSMGKAVISTSVGAEGLPVQNRENVLIADGENSFADACIELLGNPALRSQIGSSARQLVCAKYGWPKIAEAFGAALQRIVAGSRSAVADNKVAPFAERS